MEFIIEREENNLENTCGCESLSEFFELRKEISHSIKKCDVLYQLWEEDKSPDLFSVYLIEATKDHDLKMDYSSMIRSLRIAGKIGLKDDHSVYCASCESFMGELR